MALSIGQAVNNALERTKLVLFKPFDIGKWFVLGFCAFLSQCGEGGGGNFNMPSGGGGGPGGGGGTGGPTPQEVLNWLKANSAIVIAIAIGVFILVVALGALVTWLKSRGKFMFLDGVVRNRAAVTEPWNRFRDLANSLFLFSFGLSTIASVIMLGIVTMAVVVAWPDIAAQRFDSAATAGVLVAALLLPILLVFAIVNHLMDDFVVPVMYLHDQRILPAWSIAKQELFSSNVGTIVVFYLMKIVLSLAAGVVALLATCATCCITALPYIGTVILLPLFVFMRCYSLCLIEQYGPQWRLFVNDQWLGLCSRCGYDLRTAPAHGVCPECGTPYARSAPSPFPPAP